MLVKAADRFTVLAVAVPSSVIVTNPSTKMSVRIWPDCAPVMVARVLPPASPVTVTTFLVIASVVAAAARVEVVRVLARVPVNLPLPVTSSFSPGAVLPMPTLPDKSIDILINAAEKS